MSEKRIYGWKSITAALAEMLGTSISERTVKRRAHPRSRFQLPVRHNIAGPYIFESTLQQWADQYDAPHGSHHGLTHDQPGEGAA